MTSIEWVKNDDGSNGETWNMFFGCTKISQACKNCYAEKMFYRLNKMGVYGYSKEFNSNPTVV